MHCERVREQLQEEGIPFVKRDIFDARYTGAYVAKMSELGYRPPAVPVVDMKGTLVVGLDNITISSTWRALEAGREPDRPHIPGATTPPTPRDAAYEPGTSFIEPPDAPAILYMSDWCPHCPAARKFLRSRHIKWVEKNVNKPAVEGELAAHMLTLWINDGRTVPSMFLFGRILRGFDKDAVDAMIAWRKRS
jgi:glutaredoxin